MPLIVPDESEPYLLQLLADDLDAAGLVVRLFKNDLTPDADTTLGAVEEADFDGYNAAGEPLESFTAPASDGNGRQFIEADPVTFTRSSGATSNDVYGYYVTDADNTQLWWIERDASAPRVMSAEGATYTITPRLSLRSEH